MGKGVSLAFQAISISFWYVAHMFIRNLCISFPDSNVTCKGPEACVYDAIFTGYNKLTRPVNHYNKTVEVQLEFVFNALLDIVSNFVRGYYRGYNRGYLRDIDSEETK